MACFRFLCFLLVYNNIFLPISLVFSLRRYPKLAATLSDSSQEAVQVRQDIAGITAINEAFPTVMDKPAVDI